MIGAADKQSLDQLTGDGSWEEATQKIEAVRVVNLTDLAPPSSAADPTMTMANVYVAVQEPGTAYLFGGWIANRAGDKWVFTAVPSAKMNKKRASDFDSESAVSLAGIEAPPAPAGEAPKEGDAAGGEAAPGAPAAPAAPAGGPIKKNTPNGPVTIPGSG